MVGDGLYNVYTRTKDGREAVVSVWENQVPDGALLTPGWYQLRTFKKPNHLEFEIVRNS